MDYKSITGKQRLIKQRLDMLHNLTYLVIIVCGILLFIDAERFFGLFSVIFILAGIRAIEKGLTENPNQNGRKVQAAYLIVMIALGIVSFLIGLLSLYLAFRL